MLDLGAGGLHIGKLGLSIRKLGARLAGLDAGGDAAFEAVLGHIVGLLIGGDGVVSRSASRSSPRRVM
jgi:hypothetical protein